jgi:hypothetical protein
MTMQRTASHGAVVGCHLFSFYFLVTQGKPPNQKLKMFVMGLEEVVGVDLSPMQRDYSVTLWVRLLHQALR